MTILLWLGGIGILPSLIYGFTGKKDHNDELRSRLLLNNHELYYHNEKLKQDGNNSSSTPFQQQSQSSNQLTRRQHATALIAQNHDPEVSYF